MAAKTGASYVQYAPNYWYFYISKTDETRLAYRTVDVNGNDTRYQIEKAISIEPRAFVHPYNGQIYCFFGTDDKKLKAWVFQELDGVIHKMGFIPQRVYVDSKGSSHHEHINPKYNFGVTPVPDGFVVTHWNNSDKVELSYFQIDGQPATNGSSWLPNATYELPYTKDSGTYQNLQNQTSTILVEGATMSIRLVMAILAGPGSVLIREAALTESFEPPSAQSDWEEYTYTPSHDIKSDRLFMHTGPDGRAYLSFYRKKSSTGDTYAACYALRTTVSQDGQPVEPVQRAWSESCPSKLDSDHLSGLLTSTTPTASYRVDSTSTGTESLAEPLTAAIIQVIRRTSCAYNNGDTFHSRSEVFGDAHRDLLQEITADQSSGLLLGWIEGAPPLPYQNLSLPGTSTQSSIVGITDQSTAVSQTTASGSLSFMMESDGLLAFGAEGSGVGLAWKLAMEAGASWTHMKLTGVSSTTAVSQSVSDLRVLTAADIAQIPDGNDSLIGTTWPPNTGTVFVERIAVSGFVYRFIPEGYTASNLPIDIPVMYQFGPSKIIIQPLGYFIDPDKLVPGDLASYKDPDRTNHLNTFPRAKFQGGEFGAGGLTGGTPYVSWSAGGGKIAQDMSWFTSEDKSKTSFLDITALAGVAWNLEGKMAFTEGKILAGTSYSFAETVRGTVQQQLALGTKIEVRGELGGSGSYQSFTSETYFIDPPDDSAQSQQLVDELHDSLIWDGMSDTQRMTNQKILDLVDWTNSISNPWKICFVVSFSDPADIPYPPPPEGE